MDITRQPTVLQMNNVLIPGHWRLTRDLSQVYVGTGLPLTQPLTGLAHDVTASRQCGPQPDPSGGRSTVAQTRTRVGASRLLNNL